jgi:hypothetical protein
MPINIYEILENGRPTGELLEVEQRLSDSPLTHHPITKQQIRKQLSTPNLNIEYTDGKEKRLNESQYVEQKGFLKYEKDPATGHYHKTAGHSGPNEINPRAIQ